MKVEMSNNTQLPEFNKRTVAVLSETEMTEVNGGTTAVCAFTIASSEVCATAAGAGIVVLYKIWQSL